MIALGYEVDGWEMTSGSLVRTKFWLVITAVVRRDLCLEGGFARYLARKCHAL